MSLRRNGGERRALSTMSTLRIERRADSTLHAQGDPVSRCRFPMLTCLCLIALGSLSLADSPRVARVEVVIGSRTAAEGGPAEAPPSPLKYPFGVDFDAQGTMFVVELEGGRVHERKPDGSVVVIAGNGEKGYAGDDGPAAAAVFNGMHNLAITRGGRLLISDSWNHRIREITLADRNIATAAGTGEPGAATDPVSLSQVAFRQPICITLTPDETGLLVADIDNRRIRLIDFAKREVRTIAGNGKKGIPTDGALAVDSPLLDPRAAAMDSQGTVYLLERGGHVLRRVSTDGKITTIAGTGKPGFADGRGVEAAFRGPKHLCIDDQDRVWIADDENAAIRLFDPQTSQVTTILGQGEGDPRLKLSHPHGVTWEAGSLYVADSGNDRVLRIEFE